MGSFLIDALTDRLVGRLVRTLPAEAVSVRLRDLSSLGWPASVLAFLEQAFVETLEEARSQLVSPWFDFDEPSVQEAASAFWRAVYRTARLPADRRAELIEEAARAVVRHLIEPVPALVDFVFPHGAGSQELDRVLFRMRYFVAYSYLPELFEVYAHQRRWSALGREEFLRALRWLDRLFCEDLDPESWVELLTPWFACFPEGVPGEALARFFEQKERPYEAALMASRERIADAQQLLELLSGLPGVSGRELERIAPIPEPPDWQEESLQPRQTGPVPPRSEALPPGEEHEGLREEVPNSPSEEVEAWERELRERLRQWQTEGGAGLPPSPGQPESAGPRSEADVSHASQPPSEPITPASRTSESEEKGVPLWKLFLRRSSADQPAASSGPLWSRFRPTAESSTSGPELALSPEQRARFVREIFRGQEGALEALLRNVRQFPDWKSCSRFLEKQLFELYDVDPYAPATVELVDLLQAYFERRARRQG
jgi:hypothetical protein